MACKEDRYTCGGRIYLIRQMPPTQALKVEVFLLRTLGEPLLRSASQGSSTATFTAAIGLLTSRLDEEELTRVMATVFQYVGILDQAIRICEKGDVAGAGLDTHFLGKNKDLWLVFVEALRVNFADFFGESLSLSSLLERVKGLTQSSPPTSTGTSGDPAPAIPSSAPISTS